MSEIEIKNLSKRFEIKGNQIVALDKINLKILRKKKRYILLSYPVVRNKELP